MFSVKVLTAILLAGGITSATSTNTIPRNASETSEHIKATHTIAAGRPDLSFDPENVIAEIDNIVEFHFLPKNHSVTQSSFDQPYKPIDDNSFFSGFQPTSTTQSDNVFQIEVKDKTPIWYYYAQQNMNHYQSSMAGVVNQNFDNTKTLAAYKLATKGTGVSVIPFQTGVGDYVIPNPNPLSGI